MIEKPNKSKPTNTNGEFLRRWSQRKSKNRVVRNSSDEQQIGSCDDISDSIGDKVLPAQHCSDARADGQQTFVDTLSSLALRQLFRKPEVSALDGLNEYDDDFSYFVPRGDLITQEMKTKLDALSNQLLDHDKMSEDNDSIANSECCDSYESQEDAESNGES